MRFLSGVALTLCANVSVLLAAAVSSGTKQISKTPPKGASDKIAASYLSYSIELGDFPLFAGTLSRSSKTSLVNLTELGNKSNPNVFSTNLLKNLGAIQGAMPILRVGGNTQDRVLYDESVKNATHPIDPDTIHIGPSFYESYSIFPDTKYIQGFNLGKNGSDARASLLTTVTKSCEALGKDKLLYWEYGNEPDLYNNNGKRGGYTEEQYVKEWLNGTAAIKEQLKKSCPDLLSDDYYGYMAPSWSGAGEGSGSLSVKTAFTDGLNQDKDIRQISVHNYIDGATNPGVTLQATLMNHTRTVQSVSNQKTLAAALQKYNTPYVLGEFNSLYNGGKGGVSDSFGAALWGVDFTLYCAASGIYRTHMHMGAESPYEPWHPVSSESGGPPATKAPYYGNIMVAMMIGDSSRAGTQIAEIPLGKDEEIAYAAYEQGALRRIAIINMQEYNSTDSTPRKSIKYSFQVDGSAGKTAHVQRLFAEGSDVKTGVTFDGTSYDYELKQGKPVHVGDKSSGPATVRVDKKGLLTVEVQQSEAVILAL
ncbi:MAG: hypothetical protein M4579_000165 [Chaenotheca gracillima]|nr:MAG: hypothetical protein M4579_000165 [Chaenotheca gracillima]